MTLQANRDELFIDYGDGEGDTIPRISETLLPLDHKKSVYARASTPIPLQGRILFVWKTPIGMEGIINIYTQVEPGIRMTSFFSIQSKLIIDPFAGNNGANNSVVFNDCPCPAQACVGQQYCYNNLAVDIDDDSLSYMLVAPFGENCTQLPRSCDVSISRIWLMGEQIHLL